MKACEVVGVSRRTIYNWISAGKVEYEYRNLLGRKKHQRSQVELSGSERRKNLVGKFYLEKKLSSNIKGKIIILVDDVSTTGTTLEECAKVLRTAGARQIWGLVVARG